MPALQKLIQLSTSQVTDQLSIDEQEAEKILDKLKWGDSVDGVSDIHDVLKRKSNEINEEIIEFLLQWEAMDEEASKSPNNRSATKLQVPKPVTRFGESVSSPISKSFGGLQDTREVLIALSQVDEELGAVHRWLGEQIEQLDKVQKNLSDIENESGALESTWQSLNTVQEVINLLINKFSLEESEEKRLMSPDLLVNALKAPSLANIDFVIKPVVHAAKRLREALVVRIGDVYGLTVNDWKQIQAINAVRTRRERLTEIANAFCSGFAGIIQNLFDTLLKHKSLVDGDVANAPVILPKLFNTRFLVDELCFSKGVSSYVLESTYILKYQVIRNNQLLQSQSLYHAQIDKFAPLMDLILELSKSLVSPVENAYVRATHDKLYLPLVKAFIKDIQQSITSRSNIWTLANCDRYRVDLPNEPMIRYDQTMNRAGQNKAITSWKALEAVLILFTPVVELEESFIKVRFRFNEFSCRKCLTSTLSN